MVTSMIFNEVVNNRYQVVIAEAMKPVKAVKNRDGVVVEIYERDQMRALMWPGMYNNGGIWMPHVEVKIFENKEIKSPILHKSTSMSKNDFAKMGLTKDSSDDEKTEKYREYIKQHKEKYRAQMNQMFNEAEREVEALKKHVVSPEEDGAVVPHMAETVKDFIYNPSEEHVKHLLMDMKDKGYLRTMKRGDKKGQLLTDMKAINRVVLNNKLMLTPAGISALIAKDLADKLTQWSRFGFSANLIGDIRYWASKVAEQYHFSKEDAHKFENQANKTVEFYSKRIYEIVKTMNDAFIKHSESAPT